VQHLQRWSSKSSGRQGALRGGEDPPRIADVMARRAEAIKHGEGNLRVKDFFTER
jgi:hypothetical protein